MKGIAVDVASNGLEAVDMARSGAYDVILMDIQMPELDGIEATRRIRAFLPDIPIIAMTAHTMKGDAEKCLEAGMRTTSPSPSIRRRFSRAATGTGVDFHSCPALRIRPS